MSHPTFLPAPFCYATAMPPASDPAPAPPPPSPRKRWLPRLRFSLRTLVVGVMLVGSAAFAGLY